MTFMLSPLPVRVITLAVALLSLSCAGGGGEPAGPPEPAVPRIANVAIVGAADSVQVSATAQLAARATDSTGTSLAMSAVTWTSSDTTVLRVSATGLARGMRSGTATVTATATNPRGTRSGSVVMRVWAPAGPPPPLAREARALWVNRFEYSSAASIATIMEKARGANFNIVYFQVRGQGDAYYRSTLEPCAVSLCGSLGNGVPSYDPLEIAVAEAHSRGLQLHAWINAFTGWASPATNTASYCALLAESASGSPRHMLLAHPEWAMTSSSGTRMTCANSQSAEYAYVSPGIPEVRTHLARVAADIARRYSVDGVHLDRIRYPGTAWSYDTASVRRFGADPLASANSGPWAQFRRDQVSLAVRELADSVRAARPGARISAAVWGIHKDNWGWNSSHGYGQYFQDPRAWAAAGSLDVAVPMTYAPSGTAYLVNSVYCSYADWKCLLDDHFAGYAATSAKLYIGVGAVRGAEEVVRQITLARERGAAGVSIYSYNTIESRGLWTVLREGVFREPAQVP